MSVFCFSFVDRISFFPAFMVLLFCVWGCESGPSNSKKEPDFKIQLSDEWAFKTGDDLEWKEPDAEISGWDSIRPTEYWENQGYENYDGYAWYRKSFYLPADFKTEPYIQDSFVVNVATIDDTDQTFLNGHLIGQNGTSLPPGSEIGDFENRQDTYARVRSYALAIDDPRIEWGDSNVVAVRVHDHYGFGGINFPALSTGNEEEIPRLNAGTRSIVDYLGLDLGKEPFRFSGNNLISKELSLMNHYTGEFSGIFHIEVNPVKSDETIYEKNMEVRLAPSEKITREYAFEADHTEEYMVTYSFYQEGASDVVEWREEVPYILTPAPPAAARINGPSVFGSRPGSPVLYTIPVSGERPFQFEVEGLPDGLRLDRENGHIRGTLPEEGRYPVTFIAENAYGRDQKEFTFVAGEDLALTPPMGWNSWNCWGLAVDDQKVRSSAKAMKESGLIDFGWQYINIDDGWEADKRTADGELLGNEKFPDFKVLCDYVHDLGLKIGIYSSPGPETCGGHLGSYNHEYIDAQTWAQWGIDYLKYDWCSYEEIAEDHSLPELKKPYALMNEALQATDRDIVYSLCQYGRGDVWKWGNDVGGHLWRTTGDIRDTWSSITRIGFEQQLGLSPYAGPGSWNDPDMMVVGQVGWGPDLHPSRLTPNEQYSHVSLWCLLSAPMLLGNDLSKMTLFTKRLLTNDEVIAVNQDESGNQASRVISKDGFQVWMKEMHDGSLAVGLFNMEDTYRDYSLFLEDLGVDESCTIRDLWRQKDEGSFSDIYKTEIAPHGVKLIRIFPE